MLFRSVDVYEKLAWGPGEHMSDRPVGLAVLGVDDDDDCTEYSPIVGLILTKRRYSVLSTSRTLSLTADRHRPSAPILSLFPP